MKIEWLGWCIAFLIAGAGCFVVSGYLAPRWIATERKERKKFALSLTPSILLLIVGFIFSGVSLWWMYKNSIGRTGYAKYLDKSTFYRAVGNGENLSGGKFINAQNAADVVFTLPSEIQPQRGAFLRVTPNGKDLEIIEPTK